MQFRLKLNIYVTQAIACVNNILQKALRIIQVRCDQKEVVHQSHQTSAERQRQNWDRRERSPSAAADVLLHQNRSEIHCPCHVPSLFCEVFEHHVLHVAIAETAEQTRHNRALRNSSTLPVCSGNTKTRLQTFRDNYVTGLLYTSCVNESVYDLDFAHLHHNFSKIVE